ncbi:MAG: response regulator transcription factor [Actinomycetes bacterium]
MRILLVEDDRRIQSFVSKGFGAEGYVVVCAGSVAQARSELILDTAAPDLVLLDLGLPGEDGWALLDQLRQGNQEIPVIVLTARDAVSDKVRALDSGARDYVTKPFAFAELAARVRAALRISDKSPTQLLVEDLTLDLATRIATRNGRVVDLSHREWTLLEYFARNPFQLLSRTQLLSHVWDFGFDPGSNIVDVYVGYLRKKINAPGEKPLIHTVRGAGYRLLRPEDRRHVPPGGSEHPPGQR